MSDATSDELVRSWFAAIERPEVALELEALHAEIAREATERRPVCLASGQCCHFERYDHRLYVTGLDVAWCVRTLERQGGPPTSVAAVAKARARGDCPYLLEGRRCGAHLGRPLGCRIFFCDRMARDWQEDLYQRTHETLRRLHERHEIPYRYGEWRSMLAMVAAARDG